MRDNLNGEIAKVAYELHEKRGRMHGYDLQDWLEAEKIVVTRNEKGSKKMNVKKLFKALAKKKN